MTSCPRARTDRNNNLAAITTDVAREGGLALNLDYVVGDQFPPPSTLFTAKLLGDPVALTIRVIDAIGYYTLRGTARWIYIAMPKFVWDSLTPELKKQVIGFHYANEGGTEMKHLFD